MYQTIDVTRSPIIVEQVYENDSSKTDLNGSSLILSNYQLEENEESLDIDPN